MARGGAVGLGLGASAPDLLVIALLVSSRAMGTGSAAGTGFGLGLLEDAFSSLAFGANALSLTIVGAVGARTRDLFVGDSMAFVVAYLFVGKWARDFLHWVLGGGALREPFFQTIVFEGMGSAAYATAVGVAVFALAGVKWEPAT